MLRGHQWPRRSAAHALPLGLRLVDVLPGMNAGASTHAVPSPMEGSGTAWVLLGSWAWSPARPTPIHPRRERRGLSALLVRSAGRIHALSRFHIGGAAYLA
jgi:hypothetical protein